jgi:hypothetical protein
LVTQDTEELIDSDSRPTTTSSAINISSNSSGMCTTGNRRRLRRNRGGSESQFPGKLYDLLEYVSENDLESAISWSRNGTAIMVHDPHKLVEILPKFFGQTKYRSFRRQLNMWHFHRIMEGPHRGAFVHPCFIRGSKQLITYMSRHAYAAAASSPTPPSLVDFPGPCLGWQQRQQQHLQQPSFPLVDVNANSASHSYDNVSLTLLDVHPCSMDITYNLAPMHQPTSERSDERIQCEPRAICLTESPILSSTEKLQGFCMDHLNDGDPILFAGRKFHFVKYCSAQQRLPAKEMELPSAVPSHGDMSSHREEHLDRIQLDAFADDAPMVVSDVLLEPLSSEVFDTIFAVTDGEDPPERQR